MRDDRQDLVYRNEPLPPHAHAPHAHAPQQRVLAPYVMQTGAMGPLAPGPGMGGAPAAGSSEADLLRGILRHAWLVIIFALLGLGGAWLYLTNATPKYQAWAKIYIEPSGPRVLTETVNQSQRINYLFTQCEVLKSTPVLTLLTETPGFTSLRTFEKFSGNVPMIIHHLRDELEAEVGRKDDVIQIRMESKHAGDTATIVNALVTAYQKYQSTGKKTASSELLRTLQENKAAADAEMQQIRDKMFEFERRHPSLRLEMVANAELQAINQALVQAQMSAIDARSKFAANHPVRVAAERLEKEFRNRYDEAVTKATALNSLMGEYQRMALDVQQKQEFVKRLDDRIKEVEVNKDAEQIFNTITVLEPAVTPVQPSSPRRYRTIAVALAAGTLLGAGLALLRDRLDGRMRSVEEIQTIIGLPVLGVVPQMSGRRTAVARAMTVHLDPRSVVAEAYRTIRTAVYFGAGASHCKTMLVTSPEPGDGKTTSASNLAIAIAQTGRSVLLLDADFRKPTQAKNLDVNESVGLSSVLAGREPLPKALQHTGVDGLDILPCGPIPANPSEILNSREFGELVDALTQKYDHIIFDSPPVNAVTDARILGAVCDATILVLRADKSTRKSGEHARNALMSVGARVLGVIVNDAPHRKGYDVYGGSYYGQGDIVVRSTDGFDGEGTRRTLPKPTADVAE